jgi:hypothetical protein
MGQLDGLPELWGPFHLVDSLNSTGQGKQAALTATGNVPWDPFQRRARVEEGREQEARGIYGGSNLHAFCTAF